ncbi:unnamed protein product [Sphagnum jensenii]|uniref:Uncharacterized protein n=1 Tax=Sphagnum jensenii TaxID=128206 RepID=A0ABP1BI66_9BRYO
MNHDERKLAGFKCILLLTIWLILCWVLQAMEVAIDHIGCCTSKKQGSKEGARLQDGTRSEQSGSETKKKREQQQQQQQQRWRLCVLSKKHERQQDGCFLLLVELYVHLALSLSLSLSLSPVFVFFFCCCCKAVEKTGVFEDGEQCGGVSCDDDDLCHDEYSIVVVVVFVNLKICETLCCF